MAVLVEVGATIIKLTASRDGEEFADFWMFFIACCFTAKRAIASSRHMQISAVHAILAVVMLMMQTYSGRHFGYILA